MSDSIIADSSGLISLLFSKDSNNFLAVRVSKSIIEVKRRIVIPGDIFTEIVNIIGKKQGHKKAFQVGAAIISSDLYTIIDTAKEIRNAAFDKFEKQSESVSFTDCIVMAFADEFGTREIFGFDEAFRKNGYIRIGVDKKKKT